MKKILVVEDTESIREELCDILRMEGYHVFEADNGKHGLKIAKQETIHLIISDIVMPEVDGLDFFKEINLNTKTKNIPFIFLSARANKETMKTAMGMGALDYIIKPVNPDDLLLVVNKNL